MTCDSHLQHQQRRMHNPRLPPLTTVDLIDMALLRGARCAVFAASAAAPASAACATGRTSAGAAAPAHRLRRALSSTALVPVSPPSAGPASAPYTITEAPAPADGGARRPKWGRFVLKSIGGHTKKLNPIARQVSAAAAAPRYTAHLPLV